jgi:hypothetical protein
MSIIDDLMNLAQGGSSPQAQILAAMQQGTPTAQAAPPAPADSTPTPTVMQPVQDQPGVQVPVPPQRPPAEELVPKPSAVPPPLTPVPGGGNPPDLTAMYQKLQDRADAMHLIDSGSRMAVAAYSTPSFAQSLMAGTGSSQAQSPGDALTTMLKLQGMQQDKVRLAADLARIPAIAQKLGVDPAALAQLRQNDPAEYSKLIAKMAVPDNEFLKNAQNQIVLGNKRTGGLNLQGGEEGGPNAPKPEPIKTQIVDTVDAEGKPVKQLINSETNEPIGTAYKAQPNDFDKKFSALGDPSKLTDEQITSLGGRPDAWRSKIKFVDEHPDAFDLNPATPDFAAKKSAVIKSIVVPGGQTINVGGQQSALEKARNDMQAADMDKMDNAHVGLTQVAAMRDALQKGGDDIETGPMGPTYLKAKEALGGMFNVKLAGVAPAEVMQLVGTQMATTATKDISNRPAAIEWQKILTVKPGIENSREGTEAKLDLMEQHLKREKDLAIKAAQYNGPNWALEKAKYYDEHPFKSPFDKTKDLDESDTARYLGAPKPSPQAVEHLKTHPELSGAFEKKYGRGAADGALGR